MKISFRFINISGQRLSRATRSLSLSLSVLFFHANKTQLVKIIATSITCLVNFIRIDQSFLYFSFSLGRGNGAKNTLSVEKKKGRRKRRAYYCEIHGVHVLLTKTYYKAIYSANSCFINCFVRVYCARGCARLNAVSCVAESPLPPRFQASWAKSWAENL